MKENNEVAESPSTRNLELLVGVVIAIFAAVLAINDLGAGRYGDDEMIAHNNQTKMFNWYQAKSIKETLFEGQLDLLTTLEKTNSIKEEHKNVVDSFKFEKAKEIKRYELEKEEILKGSSNVDKDKWVLKDKKTNEKGTTIGAEQWEEEAEKLGSAGDMFDLSSLFLQICIVFGAISLVIQQTSTRKIFFYLMIAMGLTGSAFMISAYSIALA